jgi:ATPase subunit of ABC transporter with duplicated ATPase domains
MRSLSPGERVRAALICLYQRASTIELLVLDEPTFGLDFFGRRALAAALRAWPFGLLIASHDRDFLSEVGFEQCIELGG